MLIIVDSSTEETAFKTAMAQLEARLNETVYGDGGPEMRVSRLRESVTGEPALTAISGLSRLTDPTHAKVNGVDPDELLRDYGGYMDQIRIEKRDERRNMAEDWDKFDPEES